MTAQSDTSTMKLDYALPAAIVHPVGPGLLNVMVAATKSCNSNVTVTDEVDEAIITPSHA